MSRGGSHRAKLALLLCFEILVGQSPSAVAAGSEGEMRFVSTSGNQFAVFEAGSLAAERLGNAYPARLRRVFSGGNKLQLNNIEIQSRTGNSEAAYAAPSGHSGQKPPPGEGESSKPCAAESSRAAPNDSFVIVCTTDASELSERDRRALRGFIDYARKESLPLLAHVASEREWTALEALLQEGPTEVGSSRVPFREVRYGDGLAVGQIKLERLAR